MAETCDQCFMVLAVANTIAPSNQFTTRLTGLPWGYNRGMAKTSETGFVTLVSQNVQQPVFKPLTPDQEKAFLAEVGDFDFLFGYDQGLWGDDESDQKDTI